MDNRKNRMTGYELTERLRKTRRRHRLSAATQALYYELVAICNEEGWPDEFKCSNDELIAALQVSEKSLITYRLELIQAGLIFASFNFCGLAQSCFVCESITATCKTIECSRTRKKEKRRRGKPVFTSFPLLESGYFLRTQSG